MIESTQSLDETVTRLREIIENCSEQEHTELLAGLQALTREYDNANTISIIRLLQWKQNLTNKFEKSADVDWGKWVEILTLFIQLGEHHIKALASAKESDSSCPIQNFETHKEGSIEHIQEGIAFINKLLEKAP